MDVSAMVKGAGLLIDGKWVASRRGDRREVRNPANGEVVGDIAWGGALDAEDAVQAAHREAPRWQSMGPKERAVILHKVGNLIRERAESLSRILTRENGKPLAQALAEVHTAADNFTWYAEEGRRAYGRIVPASNMAKRWMVLRHPVGVVASISPWNFPMVLQARKVAPALAAGCTVVMRPASQTPLVAVGLAHCLIDAGVPPGVANLVTGPAEEIAQTFIDSPFCRKLTFTGSTETGRRLMAAGAGKIMRLSLELGGHAPLIVFADADIQQAARMAAAGKFRNAGQVCIAPNRFYVQEPIYDEFLNALVSEAQRMKVGNGLCEGVEVGPLINEAGFQKVMAHIDDAVALGAALRCGGQRLSGPEYDRGYFVGPTVLTDVTENMLCMKEETFGPVAPVMKFVTQEEAIAKANQTDYGLASYVFTRSFKTTMLAAERLEAGIIGINDTVPATPECPFGGMKQSGLGREGGYEGLDAFLETKFVSVCL